MSGTGGQFLSNFITAAKTKNNQAIQLSVFGNSHANNLIDFIFSGRSSFSPSHSDSLKIDAILNIIGKDSSPIYYPAMHLMDIEKTLEIFDKVISIHYDATDMFDIILVIYGKYYIDEMNHADITMNRYFNIKHELKQASKKFNSYDSPNVLNISWKEMMYSDSIVDKISLFTNIPKENFNIQNLFEWRKVTLRCLSQMNETLNTIQETNTWLIAHK
jgi:hypothetical protein